MLDCDCGLAQSGRLGENTALIFMVLRAAFGMRISGDF